MVRQGTIAQLFQAEGASVFFVGKPFPSVFQKALEYFPSSAHAKEILMIGDTPETDVRGAYQSGIASALVTQTGIMGERLGNESLSSIISTLPKTDQPIHLIPSLNIHGF